MRRLNLRQNDILRKLNHLNVKKCLVKDKSDFIREAKQLTEMYSKYKYNPNYKYFIKYLIENLVTDCDASLVNEMANELKRIFSYKVNENQNK